jgi:hypothetical protein
MHALVNGALDPFVDRDFRELDICKLDLPARRPL